MSEIVELLIHSDETPTRIPFSVTAAGSMFQSRSTRARVIQTHGGCSLGVVEVQGFVVDAQRHHQPVQGTIEHDGRQQQRLKKQQVLEALINVKHHGRQHDQVLQALNSPG